MMPSSSAYVIQLLVRIIESTSKDPSIIADAAVVETKSEETAATVGAKIHLGATAHGERMNSPRDGEVGSNAQLVAFDYAGEEQVRFMKQLIN